MAAHLAWRARLITRRYSGEDYWGISEAVFIDRNGVRQRTGGTAYSNAAPYGTNYGPEKAFLDDSNSSFCITTVAGGFIAYKFAAPVDIVACAVVDQGYGGTGTYALEWSDDTTNGADGSWTEVASKTTGTSVSAALPIIVATLPEFPDPGAKLCWRILNVGGGTDAGYSDNHAYQHVEFRPVPGTPSLATGGTAYASSFIGLGFEPANPFKAEAAGQYWVSAKLGEPTAAQSSWIGYAFGAPQEVREVQARARDLYADTNTPRLMFFQCADAIDGPWTTAWFALNATPCADSCDGAQPFLHDGAQRSWIIAISGGHPVDRFWCQFRRARSIADGRSAAPQAVALKFDAVSVVKKAVEDRVCVGGIAYGVMPRGRGELAGHDGRLSAVAIFQDFEQVMPGLGIQGLKAPVVQNEQLDAGETFEPAGDAAVTTREREFVEQAGEADVEDRAVVAAGLVADGAGEPTFPDAGWTADRQIVVRVDPLAAEQRFEQPALEPAGASVVDILRRCLMAQFGVAQARAEPLVVPPGGFPVEQQRASHSAWLSVAASPCLSSSVKALAMPWRPRPCSWSSVGWVSKIDLLNGNIWVRGCWGGRCQPRRRCAGGEAALRRASSRGWI